MKTAMFFTDKEMDILEKAVTEYEENYYASEGQEWQKIINNLIETLKKRGVKTK